MVPVQYYFILSALLFFIGVYGFISMSLFGIGVAAAETAVAIAIIINVYRNFNSDSVDSIQNMKR